ncbi:hypothetical protein H7X65_00745 [Candidatus Parcubacteria bacterium]|nr:hypothetical protein [Candidatus Parcubacteria bacterium]
MGELAKILDILLGYAMMYIVNIEKTSGNSGVYTSTICLAFVAMIALAALIANIWLTSDMVQRDASTPMRSLAFTGTAIASAILLTLFGALSFKAWKHARWKLAKARP